VKEDNPTLPGIVECPLQLVLRIEGTEPPLRIRVVEWIEGRHGHRAGHRLTQCQLPQALGRLCRETLGKTIKAVTRD
jgi:hypothetical protein